MKETKINFNLIGLTKNEILSRITELDIYNQYSKGIPLSVGGLQHSPMRDESNEDNSPSFSLYYAENGELRYKDFGGKKLTGNCFDFVKFQLQISYEEALKQIYKDFQLDKKGVIYDTLKQNTDISLKYLENKQIIPIKKTWDLNDYNYFQQYELPLEFVSSKKVYPCKYIYLKKNATSLSIWAQSTNSSPIYCWETNSKHKVYRPYGAKDFKWLATMKSDDFQNMETVNLDSDILFITKSMKDCLVLEYLGYAAVAPGSETPNISEVILSDLKSKFKTIYIFYDNDATGISTSTTLSEKTGFKSICIPDRSCKDISDYVKEYSLKAASKLIKNLINGE